MKLIEKIAKIQSEMTPLKKDTQAFKYKYVQLDQIQEKLNPLLEKHKVLLTQPLKVHEGNTLLTTQINDLESDERWITEITLPDGVKPQDMGSAITYYRRYSLLSLFNLVTEDDDGAKATTNYKDIKL